MRVNDDGSEENHHVYPSIAALPSGEAFVVWMDTRDDSTNYTALMYGVTVGTGNSTEPHPKRNVKLTQCPTRGGFGLGEYFNFDASQGKTNLIFPQIRAPYGDSDVFYMQLR